MKRDPEARSHSLSPELLGQLKVLFSTHREVESVILYGSRAQRTHRAGSDVDITITGDAVTNAVMARIECEIDDLLTPYTFDISSFSHRDNPRLLSHIERVGVTIYQRG